MVVGPPQGRSVGRGDSRLILQRDSGPFCFVGGGTACRVARVIPADLQMVARGGCSWPSKGRAHLCRGCGKAASPSACALGVSHNPLLRNGSCWLVCGFCPSLMDRGLGSRLAPAQRPLALRGVVCPIQARQGS